MVLGVGRDEVARKGGGVSDSIPKCPNCGAIAAGVTLTHVVFSCGSGREKRKDVLDNQSEKCSQSNHEEK